MSKETETFSAVIVDDEQTMRELLTKLLRHCGCTVIGRGENGREALQLLENKEPDLLFLDINMPKLNGMELLEKIDKEKVSAEICMISADAFSDNVKKAVKLGVSGFIVKPLTQQRIENFVNQAKEKIRKRRAQRSSGEEG